MFYTSVTKHFAAAVILTATLVCAIPTSSTPPTPGPKWNEKDKLVVSIDVPDADNFPMVAYTLLSNPTKKVAVILSGRKIDLGWLHWAEFPVTGPAKTAFTQAMQEIGRIQKTIPSMSAPAIKYMVAVTSQADIKSWVQKLAPEVKVWFATEDKHVKAHGEIYLEISRIRLIQFLNKLNIDPSRYQIFTQGLATDELIQGIKHAQHVHDWSWDLDQLTSEAIDKCKVVKTSATLLPYDPARGTCIAKALTDFIGRFHGSKLTASEVHGTANLKQALDKWFANDPNSSGGLYRYFAGGPMTEYNRHLQTGVSSISESVAMLQSFKRESNLLGVQFNHMIDPKSSFTAMDTAVNGKTRLFLIPTELAKKSPWSFNGDKLTTAFGAQNPVTQLCKHFQIGSSLEPALFDLITALYFKHPEIFPPAVKATYTKGADGFVELTAAQSGSKSELYVVGLSSSGDPKDLTALNKLLEDNLHSFLSILHSAFN